MNINRIVPILLLTTMIISSVLYWNDVPKEFYLFRTIGYNIVFILLLIFLELITGRKSK